MNIGENFYCPHCMKQINDDDSICPHCKYDLSQTQNVSILEEGTLLHNGRYQLGASIGSGGFGITYAAWDIALNHPVAIKEYFPHKLCERDSSEDDSVIVNPGREGLYHSGLFRFIREARILGTLHNVKNVVPVLEWFEANNTAYIVMKYISGVTLEEYVRKNSTPPQELIAMMRGLVDSLVLIHSQGILHRDISPSNIMVQDDGNMVLIDFGAASVEERMLLGEDKTVIYNRRYAPIEQYDEKAVQGPFTDVYALSATLYHLICGEPPKESVARKAGDTLKIPAGKSIRLKRYQKKAIMNGLILQPEKRTPTMAVFRSMLYNLQMPEEVLRRRRFMFRVISSAAVISALAILTVINLASGFPLGGGMRYSLHSDGFHVSGADGRITLADVPSAIAGIRVSKIDDAAFQGADKITRAVIPGTVRSVGRFAFNGCTSLASAVIGEGTQSISPQAFSGCTSLQSVAVPSTLTDIDPEAFIGHNERLVLIGEMDSPARETAERLGLNYACITTKPNDSGLTVTRYETNQNSASIPDFLNGKAVTAIESGNEESVFPAKVENVMLPASLDKLGDYALLGVMMKGIKLPGSLRYIGRRAFTQSFIESVEMPGSVISADKEAFWVCNYLRSAKISDSMTEIPEGFFWGCSTLESVTMPESIRIIGDNAFRGCRKLEHLTVPEMVRIIGNFAFEGCVSLESLYLPRALGRMPISALDGCPQSITITGRKGTFAEYICAKYGYKFFDLDSTDDSIIISPSGGMWISGDIPAGDVAVLPSYSKYSRSVPAQRILRLQSLKSRRVILPEHAHTVTAGAFAGNMFIESIDCPPSLRTIGVLAFSGCQNLSSVNLNEGLEGIGIDAFRNCKNLTDIRLPSTLKMVEAGAFVNCVGIKAVKIPSSMAMLESGVFSGTGLVSVDIPGNIVKCRQAFANCKSLRSVVFADGIRAIWGTFEGCSELETVTIPASATQISRSSFIGCWNLRDVWIYSDTVELDYMSDETRKDTYLFADSLNLTIHAHRGSNAHIYADTHGIKFSVIPSSGDAQPENHLPSFKVSGRVYNDDTLRGMIAPKRGDGKYLLWGKFQYALGYGFDDLAQECLKSYEAAGDKYDKRLASSVRLFLSWPGKARYPASAGVLFFEGYTEHPVLMSGDIIVMVNGRVFSTYDEYMKMLKTPKSASKTLTVLRIDSGGVLREIDVLVRREDPLIATMNMNPKTFEEL